MGRILCRWELIYGVNLDICKRIGADIELGDSNLTSVITK
jgi:hypothetical protein